MCNSQNFTFMSFVLFVKNLNWLMFSLQHLKILFNRNIIYIETICFNSIINEMKKNFVSKAFCFKLC